MVKRICIVLEEQADLVGGDWDRQSIYTFSFSILKIHSTHDFHQHYDLIWF